MLKKQNRLTLFIYMYKVFQQLTGQYLQQINFLEKG